MTDNTVFLSIVIRKSISMSLINTGKLQNNVLDGVRVEQIKCWVSKYVKIGKESIWNG